MLKRTPLFETHVGMGARMVEFGGWEMPVQYSGIVEEHHAVRQSAGLFDISHMGRFMVRGPAAEAFLQHVATCDVAAIPFGQSNYGLLCRPDGGVVDDIFIYRLDDEFLVVVNASNRAKDWDWLGQHAGAFDVEIEDRSERWAMLALQGPAAEALLAAADDSSTDDLANLPFHGVALTTVFGATTLIARTGYTGEDGFELLGKGVARGDYPVHSVEGEPVGYVTTGMPSPTLGKPLGMALVPTALSKEGSEFEVIIRTKPVRARAIKMPFYKPQYKK